MEYSDNDIKRENMVMNVNDRFLGGFDSCRESTWESLLRPNSPINLLANDIWWTV